jgi:hypothetical protein
MDGTERMKEELDEADIKNGLFDNQQNPNARPVQLSRIRK